MKVQPILWTIITLVVVPFTLKAQTSIGFSKRNYALMPSETRQQTHIPISSADVSYGLQLNKKNLYRDIDFELYTGIYLAQLGFFQDNPTIGNAIQKHKGRRNFLDIELSAIKEVYTLNRFQLNAIIGLQYLISLEDTEYRETSSRNTINLVANTFTTTVINFSTNRDPHNVFLNYGLGLSYSFKKIPFTLSSLLSYRDYLGDTFTNISILDIRTSGLEKYNINSTGNALEYSFSLKFNFK